MLEGHVLPVLPPADTAHYRLPTEDTCLRLKNDLVSQAVAFSSVNYLPSSQAQVRVLPPHRAANIKMLCYVIANSLKPAPCSSRTSSCTSRV